MPMPWAYRHASKDWQAFLADAQGRLKTPTDNTTYTAIDAVFQVFRRRLSVAQGMAFADLLPAVPRALFVFHWKIDLTPLPFGTRSELTEEVRGVRRHHNLTPDHAIEAVAWALRRSVNQADLDRLLASFPEGAVAYWHFETSDPEELRRRIV